MGESLLSALLNDLSPYEDDLYKKATDGTSGRYEEGEFIGILQSLG